MQLLGEQFLLLSLESLLLLRQKSLLGCSRARLTDGRAGTREHADGPSPGVVEGGLGPSCALVNAGALAPVVAITCRTLAGGALVAVAALALAASFAATLLGGASAPILAATTAAPTAICGASGGLLGPSRRGLQGWVGVGAGEERRGRGRDLL